MVFLIEMPQSRSMISLTTHFLALYLLFCRREICQTPQVMRVSLFLKILIVYFLSDCRPKRILFILFVTLVKLLSDFVKEASTSYLRVISEDGISALEDSAVSNRLQLVK